MVRRDRKRGRQTVETLNLLWGVGLALAVAIAIFALARAKYVVYFHEDPRLFYGSALLGIVTVGLFVSYLIATHRELTMMATYFDEAAIPAVRSAGYGVILGLAVLFGLMISTTDRLLVYLALLLPYDLFDVWGGSQSRRMIKAALVPSLKAAKSDEVKSIIGAIDEFYFAHPTLERAVTIMFVNWVAFSLALVYHFTRVLWARDVAYAVVVGNIVIGEVVIIRWRRRRDARIALTEFPESVEGSQALPPN